MRAVGWWERGHAAAFAALLASVVLAVGPGVAAAQYQGGSDQASSDAKSSTTQSPVEASKSQPKTAGEVGDRLHDSAKGFGEALLDSIKYAGNKVVNFFSDDKSRNDEASKK
jgi:hypothetical protein